MSMSYVNPGPVRAVSDSHCHKVLRFFADKSKWVNQHKSLLGRDAARNQLRDESHSSEFFPSSLATEEGFSKVDSKQSRHTSTICDGANRTFW